MRSRKKLKLWKRLCDVGELDEISVVKYSLTTASYGKDYRTKYYNLDVIISVGYRVKSHRGTQFRIWATKQLKNYTHLPVENYVKLLRHAA